MSLSYVAPPITPDYTKSDFKSDVWARLHGTNDIDHAGKDKKSSELASAGQKKNLGNDEEVIQSVQLQNVQSEQGRALVYNAAFGKQ